MDPNKKSSIYPGHLGKENIKENLWIIYENGIWRIRINWELENIYKDIDIVNLEDWNGWPILVRTENNKSTKNLFGLKNCG